MIEVHLKNGSIETFDCSIGAFKETMDEISDKIDRTLPYFFVWVGNKAFNLFEINYLKEIEDEK